MSALVDRSVWRAAVLRLSLALLPAFAGCSRSPPVESTTDPRSVSSARPELASATAFDLAATPDGAVLAWISGAGQVAVLESFDAHGVALGRVMRQELELVAADAPRDLSLVQVGAGAWLAWIEVGAGGGRGRAMRLGQQTPAKTLDLGAVWSGARADARGNVALMRRGESGALVLARGEARACARAVADECFEFQFYALGAEGVSRTGIPLDVPVPCSSQASQLLLGSPGSAADGAELGRFDYAVCTRSGSGPVLTVFSIEPDRSYAAAQELLMGCNPLGSGRFAGEASFVADCGADRQMASLLDADSPPRLRDISVRGMLCDGERAKVRLGSGWLALSSPLDHLELLLDTGLAPAGARAVWTGAALLVASHSNGHLELARHACRASRLERLESTATSG